MDLDPRLLVALCSATGACLLVAGVLRWAARQRMRSRVRAMATEFAPSLPLSQPARSSTVHVLVSRLGTRIGARLPRELDSLAVRLDRAGMLGGVPTSEVLGWKAVCVACGAGVGVWALVSYGAPGLVVLALGVLIGWFGVDMMLVRRHAQRSRQILRDLPTVMDLLVLSLEAGMGLDRALRTILREFHSAFADEIQRVMSDIDLGTSRGAAFERMAIRVGLEDLRALSRAIIQSDELGVSLVGVMQTQSHEVRLARRRAAEAQALEAPIKMLIPLVIFILPTLFMLLLGPVGLRAGAALGGIPVPP